MGYAFVWVFLGIAILVLIIVPIAKITQIRRARALQQPNMVMVASQSGAAGPVAVIMPTRAPGHHVMAYPMGPSMNQHMGPSMNQHNMGPSMNQYNMGSSINQHMGSSMNQPMGSLMNQPMGSSMNQTMGLQQGAPTAPPPYDESNNQYTNQDYPNKSANIYDATVTNRNKY